MDYRAEYRKKLCTPEEAVRLVKDGDWIDYTHGVLLPVLLATALSTASLPACSGSLYRQVKAILEQNKAERHLRGGEATRMKYKGT